MKINVIKPKSLFFATNCNIVINDKKYIVNKNLLIDLEVTTCDFYVSMFYLRTNKYNLKNGDSFTIQIDRILNKKKILIIFLITIFLVFLNNFFDNKYLIMTFKIFIYMFFGFILLINTIANRYFFTVKIIKGE